MFYRQAIYSCPVSLLENIMVVNSITYLYKYSEDATVTGNKKLLVFIWEIWLFAFGWDPGKAMTNASWKVIVKTESSGQY